MRWRWEHGPCHNTMCSTLMLWWCIKTIFFTPLLRHPPTMRSLLTKPFSNCFDRFLFYQNRSALSLSSCRMATILFLDCIYHYCIYCQYPLRRVIFVVAIIGKTTFTLHQFILFVFFVCHILISMILTTIVFVLQKYHKQIAISGKRTAQCHCDWIKIASMLSGLINWYCAATLSIQSSSGCFSSFKILIISFSPCY